ncbi:hypothetical protein BH10PSE12_BH10PSE12_13930 [soil metagenome]
MGAMDSGHDPRVDAYIAAKADFARPILTHLRDRVHAGCPDIVEAMKWGMPFFVHKGQNVCHMAAFKAHAAFGFWRGGGAGTDRGQENSSAMGQFGRIVGLDDLPSDDALAAQIADAVALIDAGGKPSRVKREAPRAALPVAPELLAAIMAQPAAAAVWAGFSPGKIRDYAEWIGEAKQVTTRDKRIAQAVEWIAQGKDRNWKYRR